MREDRILKAPSLLELSAEVVASGNKPSILLHEYDVRESKPPHEIDGQSSTSSSYSPFSSQKASSVRLPQVCAEEVLDRICSHLRDDDGESSTEEALMPFLNEDRCPVSRANLSGLQLSNSLLAELLRAQQATMQYLDLSRTRGVNSSGLCPLLMESSVNLNALKSLKLTSTDLLRIPKRQLASPHAEPSRRSLPVVSEEDLPIPPFQNMSHRFGNCRRYLHRDVRKIMEGSDDWNQLEEIIAIGSDDDEELCHFAEFCPKLEQLVINQENALYNVEDEAEIDFFTRIFSALPALQTVDLSEWKNIASLNPLRSLPILSCLVLYDVLNLDDSTIQTIAGLSTLSCLDISLSDRNTCQYTKPVTCLHSLVLGLPQLRYLDISGTNLLAPASDSDRPFRGVGSQVESDIAGLSFLKAPLHFLGIFNCQYSTNFRKIPAERVAGEHGEFQILQALEVYVCRPKMMELVLNESYQLYRFSTELKHHVEALYFVLDALDQHPLNNTLQIAGSASLFYIIRHVKMNRDTKRRVIATLVKAMENHIDEQVLVRNCCLSLCQFEIPLEILFNYGRVARLLVRVMKTSGDQLTQRIIVFLLNSMACHVEGDQKVEVGNMGAIEIILEQVRRKHAAVTCDDVMEVGWSFLWNVTDETPSNCERFLEAEGLKLFQDCYQQFPNELELVRNMMGLIGNIAEVEELRSQLMEDSYIRIFCTLLDTLTDGIEISYNSAGVLAHLVSDGVDAWKSVQIQRDDIMKEIVRATGQWKLTARRYINYRSFKPILRLVPLFHSPGAQHWALWALANLTSTDVKKYCRFIQDEGGENLMHQIVCDDRSSRELQSLARIVLHNVEAWRRDTRTIPGLFPSNVEMCS